MSEVFLYDENVSLLFAGRPGEQFVYLKYWKPVGVVCTTDRSIRDNIIDAVHTRN